MKTKPEKLDKFMGMINMEITRNSLSDLLELWDITYEGYKEIIHYIVESGD